MTDAGPADYRRIRPVPGDFCDRPSRNEVEARKPNVAAAREVSRHRRGWPFGLVRSQRMRPRKSHSSATSVVDRGSDCKPAPISDGLRAIIVLGREHDRFSAVLDAEKLGASREQVVERRVQARELGALRSPGLAPGSPRGRPPRRGSRWRGRACGGARPARPASRRREDRRRVCSPGVSQGASTDAMSSNTRPGARRSHCSRPQGSAPTRPAARARTSSVGSSSRRGKHLDLGEVGCRALVVDAELGEPIDLVAHRSTRTGTSAVDGNTSTIEPLSETSPRCSTRYSRRYPSFTSSATSAAGSTC